MRLFLTWLIELDYREDSPTTGLKVKRGKTVPTKPLTPAEIAALVSSCHNERDALMVLLLAHTVIRISELAAAKEIIRLPD